MKRVLLFVLLGPSLGFATGFYLMLPTLNWALGESSVVDWHQVVLLPAAYMLGGIPAIVTGCVDEALARRAIRWRVLWTTLFAFGAAFLPLATALAMGFLSGPYILAFGIIGAVPGALCSCLAKRLLG